MQIHAIHTNQQQPSFTSLNNPINKFRIKTSHGNVSVKEFTEYDSLFFDNLKELSRFIIDSFIDGSTSPGWKKYTKPNNRLNYQNRVLRFNNFIRNVFKQDDGNSNVLVARDKKGNIVGAIISYSLNEIRGLKDSKTLYIDTLGVDKKYRHNNIAKILMEKVFEAGKDIYTDSMLTGYNKAVPFYEKLGYKKVDLNNPIIKMYYDILRRDRTDIPKFTKLMDKPLNENKKRWWERMNGRIINYYENMR